VSEPQQSPRKRRRVWIAREGDDALALRLGGERLKRGHRPAQIVLHARDVRRVKIPLNPSQQFGEDVRHLSKILGRGLQS